MAEDLNLQLLKAQLPGLHRDAQAGDASARRELVRVIGLIDRMEARAGFDTPQTATQPTEGQRGFTAPIAAPGQDVSRLKKRELDQHLAGLQDRDEAPPTWMELYDALLPALIHILRCRRYAVCRSRGSPSHLKQKYSLMYR